MVIGGIIIRIVKKYKIKVVIILENGFEKFIYKNNKLYYAYISIKFPNKATGQNGIENQSLTKIEFIIN